MGTKVLKSFGILQNELEEAKNSLKGVDEHLKRLIGRDPSELPPRNNLKRSHPDDKGRLGVKNANRIRNFTFENEEPQNKRRNHISVFKRLSEKIDDTSHGPQKGMISKVIVTNKEIPSREEALEAQSKDQKFRDRNRRMFGALLGTLQKFQQEETKLKPREEKRAQLEKKIEEHEIKEKLEIKKERHDLFLSRKKKQAEIKLIELKMLRMKEYALWEESQKPRMNFIKTKAKPPIVYLPRRLTDKTKELLENSKNEIEQLLDKKKQQISSELQGIEERMKRSFEFKYGPKEGKHNATVQEESHDQEHVHSDHDDTLTEAHVAVEKDDEDSNGLKNKEEHVQELHDILQETATPEITECTETVNDGDLKTEFVAVENENSVMQDDIEQPASNNDHAESVSCVPENE